MVEIELKARLRNPSLVRDTVASFATYVREFDKSDAYWQIGRAHV